VHRNVSPLYHHCLGVRQQTPLSAHDRYREASEMTEGRLMAADGTVLATATTSARLVEAAKAIR